MKIENRLISALNQEVEFKIGQNANDNFDIIDSSNPSDLWFHLSGESSLTLLLLYQLIRN